MALSLDARTPPLSLYYMQLHDLVPNIFPALPLSQKLHNTAIQSHPKKSEEKNVSSLCHERGTKKNFLVPMRKGASDLRISRSAPELLGTQS